MFWFVPQLTWTQIGDVLNTVGVEDPATVALINGSLQIWNFFVAISTSVTPNLPLCANGRL